MSIKDLSIRCQKKGKTRGRPSKEELTMSQVMSYYINTPEFKNSLSNKLLDYILSGTK